MADIIIMAVIAAAVFLIVRRELRRFRRGQCGGGCVGCDGSCACGGSKAPAEPPEKGKD